MSFAQIKQMRNFHNNVKKQIIHTVCNNRTSMLDIGVGRGGDILKWHNANIQNVIGIDLDSSYIQEARNRFENSTHSIKRRNYKFYEYNGSDINVFLTENKLLTKFEVISCQFAIHYFFKDQETLTYFLRQVSNMLNTGGYFIGTAMSGNKIHEFLKRKDTNGIIYIKKMYETLNYIGDLIHVYMHGTLYFKEHSISEEYLVFEEKLIEECKKYNLKVISTSSFEDLYAHALYDISFQNIKETSFLNFTFIFQKV